MGTCRASLEVVEESGTYKGDGDGFDKLDWKGKPNSLSKEHVCWEVIYRTAEAVKKPLTLGERFLVEPLQSEERRSVNEKTLIKHKGESKRRRGGAFYSIHSFSFSCLSNWVSGNH